ncbi:MAG TPA: hypothetical protein PK095_18140 [Myxococcota bacterium]|nr:hypothetical protein [Myxococcota bacterium]
MAAATTIETPETKAPANRWDKVHATITSLRGQVTSRVESFRKSVETARAQGTERVAALRGELEKLVANGKKLAETASKDLQKIADKEQLKALVAKLQSTIEGLRKKGAKPVAEQPVTEATEKPTE